ncbi:MAG TPA: TfoX/Sxy family protein [Holophagaceae bacterium]|nr:TfoX/Sxy family protein [Holophagaceae bacterium]
MAISASYRTWVLEQLGQIQPVQGKPMFGGLGIYADALFFALADDDRLYFKVDDATRPAFVDAGMGAFDPFKDGRTMEGYYEVPGEVLEDDFVLSVWMERALGVAARAKKPKKAKAVKG